MGTTLTNWQLDITGFEKEQALDEIRALFRREGYEVSDNADDTDMVMYLLYNPNSRWLAICEKDLSATSMKDLKSRALKLARHFGTCAIASMVYDSDVLAMYLHNATTQKKDLVVLDPENGYLDELGYNPKTSKGKAEFWAAALGCDAAALKALWEKEYVFAEQQLNDIGDVLGVADTAGFYVFEEQDKEHWIKDYELITLPLKSLLKGAPPYEIIKEGPAIIGVLQGTNSLIWNEYATFCFLNKGGPHTGAYFYLESPLFADHDFDFSEVTIERRKVFNGNNNSYYTEDLIVHTAAFQKEKSQDGSKWFMTAYFPDFPIPEGVKVNYETQSTWRKVMDVTHARKMTVHFDMRGDNTIRGRVRAFLMPINGMAGIKHSGHGADLISRDEHDKNIQDLMKR